MGGAHAIAALAYGTETIRRVDVIAGPGQPLGPGGQAPGLRRRRDRRLRRAERRARARRRRRRRRARRARRARPGRARAGHARRSPSSDDGALLDAVAARARRERRDRGAALALVARRRDSTAALALAEAFAPEHLQLSAPTPRRSRRGCARAGCVFVGARGATAFGDYVAGSNHTLPTGGAARFASGLGAAPLPPAHEPRCGSARRGGALAPAGARDRARRGLRRARELDGGCGRMPAA